jgi:LysM repeat protein
MSARRLAVFVVINAIVSALVVLVVLSAWDSSRSATAPIPTLAPTVIVPIATVPIGPTATPIGPRSYIVESGDTPISIATQFDIPLQALLTANRLREGDILNIGQTLVIPVVGATPAAVPTTPTATVIALSTSTPVSASTSSVGGLLVTIRQIDSAGLLANEAIVLINLGDKVNLSGWTLSDGDGHKYTFPDLTLLSNAEVRIHTSAGTNTSANLYWGQANVLWGGSGIIAYLRDPGGKLMATYRVP